MAYDKITFQKKINDSVQVGDNLYYSDVTGAPTDPVLVGTINWVGEKEIRIDPNTAPDTTVTTLTSYINIMDGYNGTFDTDISSWTLDALTGSSPTTNGICSNNSYDNDPTNCLLHGDCGTLYDTEIGPCAAQGVCSSWAGIHLT